MLPVVQIPVISCMVLCLQLYSMWLLSEGHTGRSERLRLAIVVPVAVRVPSDIPEIRLRSATPA